MSGFEMSRFRDVAVSRCPVSRCRGAPATTLNCRRHFRYPHEYAYYPCIRQCLIKLTRDRIPETNGIGRTSSLSLRTQQPKQMEPDGNNKSERFLNFSQAAGTMHKDINAIEKQEDTIVEEVVVHLQSNSEQLRSKPKGTKMSTKCSQLSKKQEETTSLLKGMNSETNKQQDSREAINKVKSATIAGVSVDQVTAASQFCNQFIIITSTRNK
uniref:Uncharacterized protein n=1 Tax=Caenorhabditis japonica TaxID=281687 RepID=A0A8R1E7S1_CAEJA